MGRKGAQKASRPVEPSEKTGREAEKQPTYPFTLRRFLCYLWEPEDAAYLAFYRIFWGIIMWIEVWSHIKDDYGKMHMSWYPTGENSYLFKYAYFEWVEPISVPYMKMFLWLMIAAAVGIIIGFEYRMCSTFFAFGFAYMFFMAQGTYLNHFYLVMLIAFVMMFLPCNTIFSVDAYLKPEKYKPTVPKICLLTLQLFQAIVYFYAGVAKVNEDWLRAEPLRHWLPKRHKYPFIGWLLTKESVCYWFSYSGMIYDLSVGFLLMCRRTLWIGVFSTMFFHLTNRYIFNIGIFPMVMIASTTLYFEADWPRRLLLSGTNTKYRRVCRPPSVRTTKIRPLTWKELLLTVLALLFVCHQVALPLRHWAYPGNVAWNELGHKYSWRMKLRDKMCDCFFFMYIKEDKMLGTLDPTHFVHPRQASKMQSRPDMIAQFTNHAVERLRPKIPREFADPEIYGMVQCRLNFREYYPFLNLTYDLAHVDPLSSTFPFVVPLPDMPEEYLSEYPWNFEWNFNWLFGRDRNTLEILQRDYAQHRDENRLKDLLDETTDRLATYLADRDHGGDVKKLQIHKKMPDLLNKVV